MIDESLKKLEKWYHIPKNQQLELHEQEEIVALLMAWIRKEN